MLMTNLYPNLYHTRAVKTPKYLATSMFCSRRSLRHRKRLACDTPWPCRGPPPFGRAGALPGRAEGRRRLAGQGPAAATQPPPRPCRVPPRRRRGPPPPPCARGPPPPGRAGAGGLCLQAPQRASASSRRKAQGAAASMPRRGPPPPPGAPSPRKVQGRLRQRLASPAAAWRNQSRVWG